MLPRRLLPNDVTVPLLGLGTVRFGRLTGLRTRIPSALPTDAELHRLLDTARDLGIDLLDTAPAYGSSEQRLGRLLQERKERWLLSTKVGETFADGQSTFDFSESAIRASIERSLQRLHTQRLDIVWIHSDGDDMRILDDTPAIATLRALQAAGRIGLVGMSSKTAAGGRRALDECDLVMVTRNLLYREEETVVNVARPGRIFVKKALASGALGKQIDAALRHAANHPSVACVLSGTLDPQHLRQAARALSAAAD